MQDIKKLFLLVAYQQSLSSGQKTFTVITNFGKKIITASLQAIFKPFYIFLL
jgi:hypothetical protein